LESKKFIFKSVGIATIISYLMLFATFFLEEKGYCYMFTAKELCTYWSVLLSLLLVVSFFRHQHVKCLATLYLVPIIIMLFLDVFGLSLVFLFNYSLILTVGVTCIYMIVQVIKDITNRKKN